ncbi:hypothetical protein IWX90DRAFT_485573 [Phyllosticta citrichinensis]|uniref:Large ribosomal subunit protein mL50 n=1 Tax=Phyllosticta citrichinensis TaxID=1130410 RepID=A0ABR1XW99_9PEZI
MRQLTRLTRSIDRTLESIIRPSAFSPVCCTCRQTAAPFSTSSTRAADQPKRSSQSFEAIRRKIWGTDTPPGREDPYDPKSPMRQIEETESKPVRPGQAATAETTAEAEEDTSVSKLGPRRINRSSEGGYQPARTWEGLEWVGTPDWAWKQKPMPSFKGQSNRRLSADPEQQAGDIQAALRKALIEVVAQREAFRDVIIAAKQGGKPNWTDRVELGVDKNKKLVLRQIKETKNAQALEGEKPAWFDASLRDPGFKFQVAKRFLKATGIPVSDIALQQSNDPGLLLHSIKNQINVTKKEKLAETLKNSSRFQKLTNVKIVDRRVTPIDKEKEVGRWKLIEDELLERGLPVTGRPLVQ